MNRKEVRSKTSARRADFPDRFRRRANRAKSPTSSDIGTTVVAASVSSSARSRWDEATIGFGLVVALATHDHPSRWTSPGIPRLPTILVIRDNHEWKSASREGSLRLTGEAPIDRGGPNHPACVFCASYRSVTVGREHGERPTNREKDPTGRPGVDALRLTEETLVPLLNGLDRRLGLYALGTGITAEHESSKSIAMTSSSFGHPIRTRPSSIGIAPGLCPSSPGGTRSRLRDAGCGWSSRVTGRAADDRRVGRKSA